MVALALLLQAAPPAAPEPAVPQPAVQWTCSLTAPSGQISTVMGSFAAIDPGSDNRSPILMTSANITTDSGGLLRGTYRAGLQHRGRKHYTFAIRGEERTVHVSFDFYPDLNRGVMTAFRYTNGPGPRFEPVGIGYCDALVPGQR